MWIQTGVTVRKRLSWVTTSVTLTFDLWHWSFAWTSLLSLVITPANLVIIRWWEHSQKGVTDRQTDRQTYRPFIELLGRSWKRIQCIVQNQQDKQVRKSCKGRCNLHAMLERTTIKILIIAYSVWYKHWATLDYLYFWFLQHPLKQWQFCIRGHFSTSSSFTLQILWPLYFASIFLTLRLFLHMSGKYKLVLS